MKFNALVIDGDSLMYRCGFAAKGEPVENALHSFKLQVQAIEEATECFLTRMYIKGEGNFRNALSVSRKYKGNRTQPPPEHYDAIVEYAVKYCKAVKVNGMEADDMCSVLLYNHRSMDSGFVLAAMDKDLWNTPGWHYNYNKKVLEYVTIEEANLNFLHQMLTGDSSDNIPGLPFLVSPFRSIDPGAEYKPKPVGTKRAQQFLEGKSSKEAALLVQDAYKAWGDFSNLPEEETQRYFLEQGRLLWMTRRLNADGTPVLWEPPAFLDWSVDWSTQGDSVS